MITPKLEPSLIGLTTTGNEIFLEDNSFLIWLLDALFLLSVKYLGLVIYFVGKSFLK